MLGSMGEELEGLPIFMRLHLADIHLLLTELLQLLMGVSVGRQVVPPRFCVLHKSIFNFLNFFSFFK